jgi:hypothetical protein
LKTTQGRAAAKDHTFAAHFLACAFHFFLGRFIFPLARRECFPQGGFHGAECISIYIDEPAGVRMRTPIVLAIEMTEVIL